MNNKAKSKIVTTIFNHSYYSLSIRNGEHTRNRKNTVENDQIGIEIRVKHTHTRL